VPTEPTSIVPGMPWDPSPMQTLTSLLGVEKLVWLSWGGLFGNNEETYNCSLAPSLWGRQTR
jgi:hypothetical protein